ncbi:MAG: 6-bladed beta-propeller [Thermodesulfobacteriota bacterium]
MKGLHRKNWLLVLIATLFLVSAWGPPSEAKVAASFLYNLSDFTGVIPFTWTRVSVDQERDEIYVLHENRIRVFNAFGMEVYRFGDDLDLGQIVDIAIDQEGNILLLSYTTSDKGPRYSIHICNYRGEPTLVRELKDLPPKFAGFSPNRMVYRDGNLYFVSFLGLEVVVTDFNGNFKKGYDLLSLLELGEKDRGSVEISGFSVDKEGNILFTVAVLFKAYVLSADGRLDSFGRPGGAPGRFNVVAGIVADSKGNYLIADKLKSAIMVFDKKYNFLTQFGYRGSKPGNLVVPDEIAIDQHDRVFITQARKRGVSVFRITH